MYLAIQTTIEYTLSQENTREEQKMVGENLKYFRTNKGMTQEDLAKSLNIARPVVTQFERGTRQVPAHIIIELMQILGCTADELLFGKE